MTQKRKKRKRKNQKALPKKVRISFSQGDIRISGEAYIVRREQIGNFVLYRIGFTSRSTRLLFDDFLRLYNPLLVSVGRTRKAYLVKRNGAYYISTIQEIEYIGEDEIILYDYKTKQPILKLKANKYKIRDVVSRNIIMYKSPSLRAILDGHYIVKGKKALKVLDTILIFE